MSRIFLPTIIASLLLFFGGCVRLLAPSLMEPFSVSLARQTNIDLLKEGMPSFLLTMDGLVLSSPDTPSILLEAARAYSFYASLLDVYGEGEKAAQVGERAREYGIRLIGGIEGLNDIASMPIRKLEALPPTVTHRDLPLLFWGSQAWSVWLWQQGGSPRAAAEFPRVNLMMQRVLELDETYYYGSAHLFFGAYFGTLPVVAGGDPEKSRFHFERALTIGKRRFLLAHVLYAETYARQTMDRALYESLLREAAGTIPEGDEIAAVNALARKKAEIMLARTAEYF